MNGISLHSTGLCPLEGPLPKKLDLRLNADAPLTAHTVRASALRINTGFPIGRVSTIRIFGLNADALIKETSGFLAGRVLKTQLFFNCESQLFKGFVCLSVRWLRNFFEGGKRKYNVRMTCCEVLRR